MPSNLRILILEDNPNDADLLNRELKRSGLSFTSEIVQTRAEFEHALQHFNPDLILSDYSLPSFDAVTAFRIKQNKLPHIPFIIISGVIGEEIAVDLIKNGVTDYASKDKLFTLSSKINRALKDSEEWKEKQINAEKLKIQAAALIVANKELVFQNEEKEKRAAELIIANKELVFQNEEKEKRTAELIIAKEKVEESEIRLKEMIQNLEEMVHIASHDLQSPLVSMEGYATGLLEKYADKLDEEGKYCLTRLQSNARRMHALVLSLLDISLLNTIKYPYEKCRLNLIIEKIIQDISLTIEKQNAVITVGKLPEILADRIRIESIFRNLIINSLNYGGKNLALGFDKNNVFVKDDGIGIPESQLERIFNVGERLKKNNAEGAGMGLTFCKKVIEQHKGKIWAESEGVNKGSTFYINLP